MKKYILLALLFSFIRIYGGDPSRNGTTGGEQLLIPVSARGIALSGAFLSDITGLESLYYNPAGLDLGANNEAMFSYMSYIADINVSYFAIGSRLGSFGSLAISFKSIDFGDIPVTTVDNPDGTGSFYTPSFITAALSYGKKVSDKISIGFSAKIIYESILNSAAAGAAIDFGAQYSINNFSLGAAVKNIGTNMSYTGSDLQVKTTVPGSALGSGNGIYQAVAEESPVPGYVEFSTAYHFNVFDQNKFMAGSRYRSSSSSEDQLAFGIEYAFMNTFFIRAGYDMMLTDNAKQIYGPTLGTGINYYIADELSVSLDYAYRTVKEFANPNHVFTVKLMLE